MNPIFEVHKLNARGLQRAKLIAEAFDLLLVRLASELPVGRELYIVKTKLEEACFFAKKAMANDPDNQES